MTPASPTLRSILLTLGLGALLAGPALAQTAAEILPGKGVKVVPVKSALPEEAFQTTIVVRALERLGYDVASIEEATQAGEHELVASGAATFMATHLAPLQDDLYAKVGGDAQLWRNSAFITDVQPGWFVDKKTADAHGIQSVTDLQKPEIAKLFDRDGDGRANLIGCNADWACAGANAQRVLAWGLGERVQQEQGDYAELMREAVTRVQQGESVLYYGWSPYWVAKVLQPGRDVVALTAPQVADAAPAAEATDAASTEAVAPAASAEAANVGFGVNTQRIVVNRAFIEANPVAARLFEVIKLPASDIGLQNYAMYKGQFERFKVDSHVDGWLRANQDTFNGWIAEALKVPH